MWPHIPNPQIARPAGCTIQDELFASFEEVLSMADRNGMKYDRIVLENSGVAEPQNIRDAFTEALENGHPVMQRVHLSSLVRSASAPVACRALRLCTSCLSCTSHLSCAPPLHAC